MAQRKRHRPTRPSSRPPPASESGRFWRFRVPGGSLWASRSAASPAGLIDGSSARTWRWRLVGGRLCPNARWWHRAGRPGTHLCRARAAQPVAGRWCGSGPRVHGGGPSGAAVVARGRGRCRPRVLVSVGSPGRWRLGGGPRMGKLRRAYRPAWCSPTRRRTKRCTRPAGIGAFLNRRGACMVCSVWLPRLSLAAGG